MLQIKPSVYRQHRIINYEALVNRMMSTEPVAYKRYPTVSPMWDNSARRKSNAIIFEGSTPELYGRWLEHVVRHFTPYSKDENFVFINAWNEWAEGNHLEPCQQWGHAYLKATQQAFANA